MGAGEMATDLKFDRSEVGVRAADRLGVDLPLVLIVSDVRLYREGLAQMLSASGRIKVVGMVREAELYFSNLVPDVVLVDVRLIRGLKNTTLLGVGATAKVIAFAVSEVEDDILACAQSGTSGFVGEDASVDDIIGAIEGVIRGELSCPPRVAGMLFQQLTALARSQANRANPAGLTSRELEVIGLLGQGRSNKEIACQLGIGSATVKNHVHNILEKLDVHRRGEVPSALRSVLRIGARDGLRGSVIN